jgi:hypothetical protein
MGLDMMTHLENLYTRRDAVTNDKQIALERMLTPDQRAILLKFDAEYEEIADAIKAAEEQVKAAVIETGETIKGSAIRRCMARAACRGIRGWKIISWARIPKR